MAAVAILLVIVAGMAFAQTPKRGGVLKMTSSKQGVLTKNFNPFSPAALDSAIGCVYETLIYFNNADGSANPWLAESWSWSPDLKEITFTLRPGIKFNDGTPLTANDVVFTTNLGKTNKALDVSGIWSEGLVSVNAIGTNKVVSSSKTLTSRHWKSSGPSSSCLRLFGLKSETRSRGLAKTVPWGQVHLCSTPNPLVNSPTEWYAIPTTGKRVRMESRSPI